MVVATSTMVAIGAAMAVVGAATSAVGVIQQGEAAKKSADYNAEVAANNAKIADQNAKWAGHAGEQQAAIQQQKTRAAVGAMLADQGASGVDVESESSKNTRASAAELGQLDAMTIRSNAARQAYGYEVDSSNSTAQSQLDKFQGENAKSASNINAGSTLLSGLGSAATNYASIAKKSSAVDTSGSQ